MMLGSLWPSLSSRFIYLIIFMEHTRAHMQTAYKKMLFVSFSCCLMETVFGCLLSFFGSVLNAFHSKANVSVVGTDAGEQ